MHRLFLGLWLACGGALAQDASRWWVGFIDANDRAFMELPAERAACAERDRLVTAARAAPGSVLVGRASPAHALPPGARLTFAVIDLQGRVSERVLTRTVAVVREDEQARLPLLPVCWYLAQAGVEAAGYRVSEDRLALAVHPPRALAVRSLEDGWMTYGALSARAGSDRRFAADTDMPAGLRARVEALLPGASQFHAQPFAARLAAGRGLERFWLIGAIARPDGDAGDPATYATLNLIVPDSPGFEAPALYQAGPSAGLGAGRVAGFAAQVVAAVDLDGDGGEELVLRARYYAGGNLKVLHWDGHRLVEIRQTGYEGE